MAFWINSKSFSDSFALASASIKTEGYAYSLKLEEVARIKDAILFMFISGFWERKSTLNGRSNFEVFI